MIYAFIDAQNVYKGVQSEVGYWIGQLLLLATEILRRW